MGRYYTSSKQEADSLHKIQIWWLKKNGYLEEHCYRSGGIKWTNGWSGQESSINISVNLFEVEPREMNVSYDFTKWGNDKKEHLDYKIPIVSTSCNFGGKRYWFICPWYRNNKYCGRRVGVLYQGGKYFACRHCYDLSYDSRNENRRYRDYALFYVFGNRRKIERLEQSIKVRYYNGNPTRKQRRLMNLMERDWPYEEKLMDIYRNKKLTK